MRTSRDSGQTNRPLGGVGDGLFTSLQLAVLIVTGDRPGWQRGVFDALSQRVTVQKRCYSVAQVQLIRYAGPDQGPCARDGFLLLFGVIGGFSKKPVYIELPYAGRFPSRAPGTPWCSEEEADVAMNRNGVETATIVGRRTTCRGHIRRSSTRRL